MASLYNGTIRRIKIGNKLSCSYEINKGLRQSCYLTPTLFNIYVEQVLKEQKRKYSGMAVHNGDDVSVCR